MLNILKRNIPKWEKSGQGEGGQKADDNNDIIVVGGSNFVKDDVDDDAEADDVMIDIACNDDSSGSSVNSEDSLSSSYLRESAKMQDRFGITDGHDTYALALRTEFLQKKEKHALYFWHMLNKHNLFGNAMSMLRDSVGSRDGADGIPSPIIRKADDDGSNLEDHASLGSKSLSSIGYSISIQSERSSINLGIDINNSINDYGAKMIQFANMQVAQKMKEHKLAKQSKNRDQSLKYVCGHVGYPCYGRPSNSGYYLSSATQPDHQQVWHPLQSYPPLHRQRHMPSSAVSGRSVVSSQL